MFPMSDQHRNMITEHIAEVCEFLDPENFLLNTLLSLGVITVDDHNRICNEFGFYNKATELMKTILRKSDDAFQALIISLNETGQSHVVYILTGEGDSRPLSVYYREKLNEKREVVHSIVPHSLMTALISKGVFTSYDKERVEARRTQDEKAEMMLDLIARKSQSAFDDFIEILRCSACDHKHVAEALMPTVTSAVEATSDDPEVDVENIEDEIREDMSQTLADDESHETELKRELEKNGISVSEVRKGSIIVKFTYKDHTALISLQKLYSSKKLDQLFTEAFCPKFADKGLKSLRLVILQSEFQRHFELRLMTRDHRNALRSLSEHICDKLTVGDDFLDKLSLCKLCREVVKGSTTREQQVNTLCDIVSRQPDPAFTRFLNALDDTQQTEAASYLRRLDDAGVCETENLHLLSEESSLRLQTTATARESSDDKGESVQKVIEKEIIELPTANTEATMYKQSEQANRDHHANQMNPNSAAYQARMDHHANQYNPGSSAYNAAANNRSNQMNPNNPAYTSSRQGGEKQSQWSGKGHKK